MHHRVPAESLFESQQHESAARGLSIYHSFRMVGFFCLLQWGAGAGGGVRVGGWGRDLVLVLMY